MDNHYSDPSLQGQGQLEGQLQGELQGQGQLQGQGELQGQGQGQAQTESTTSLNGNGNGNGNLNLDGNGNGNANLNGNENSNCDNASSSATSAADNCSTTCDNVNVNVNVAVADTVGPPTETSVLNMDGLSLCNTDGSFVVMPDLGTQTLNGSGNIFHLDQVNDLVSNGTVSCLTDGLSADVSGGGSGGTAALGDTWHLPSELGGNGAGSSFSFSQSASATGGTATLGDAGTAGAVGGAVTQEAFTQHVILGSNIQYNSMPINIVGGDSITAGHDVSHTG
jgi:hypothetical protein